MVCDDNSSITCHFLNNISLLTLSILAKHKEQKAQGMQ
jgi:hypothetical protein